MKLIVGLMFVMIAVSLFSGLYFLVRDPGHQKRTVKALTYRIGLSVALLLLLIISAFMGWIKPHGVKPPEIPAAASHSSIDNQ